MDANANTKTMRIGDVLVERGLVTPAQIEEAIGIQKQGGKRLLLGEIIIDRGFCSRAELTEALADAYGVPFVHLTAKHVDPEVLQILPREFVTERLALPLFHVDGVLTVAVIEPANFVLIDEISQIAGCSVQIVAALPEEIEATLEQLGPNEAQVDLEEMISAASYSAAVEPTGDRADLEEMGSDSPVVRLVNQVIHDAIRDGASDIHFEPDEDTFRIRNRIDGQLVEKINPPVHMQAPIVARIKIMAGMDISERRLPQDGAIRVTSKRNPVDLRVSTLPNKFGEKVVIRVIDNTKSLLSFDGLGLSGTVRSRFIELCTHPYGMILVTGPTGSGKSSTLYSMLNHINTSSINICTVEDPIEFNLKGVNQFQVHTKIGLTFASCLRTLLRQDPDVIMVGEIRDPETAGIAMQAALTGHLVLATLHTNDSAGAITRLENLSVEPYLVSAALVGVVAQRLVRRICPKCKVEAELPAAVQHAAERAGVQLDKAYRGRGCAACGQSGYKGRCGVYEVLVPGDELRDAIASGANLGKLRKLAKAEGMNTLFEYGLECVRNGTTTVEELLRVTCE